MNSEELKNNLLPKSESARLAVLRSREIVKRNNEFIQTLKLDAGIDLTDEASNSIEISNSDRELQDDFHQSLMMHPKNFELHKIKSRPGPIEFFKDLLGL